MPALAVLALTVALGAAAPARAELRPIVEPRTTPAVPGIKICKRKKSANSVAPNVPGNDSELDNSDDDTDPPADERKRKPAPQPDSRGSAARGSNAAGPENARPQGR